MARQATDVLADWPNKPVGKGRLPYGYVLSESGLELTPDLSLIFILDEALDQLDAGISLREVADWYNSRVPEDASLSHAGFSLIRRRLRPDFVRKRAAPKVVRKTHAERAAERRKQKIANERRKITAAAKRIEKNQEEISVLLHNDAVDKSPMLELPTEVLEYERPIFEEDDEVVFAPNPGPQERFLAAPELEVLYGGAAGGGKSFALLADPMRYFGNPNFNGLLLRRTNDELRELIWKSQELYPRAYPKSRFSGKTSSWTFPAGGHLWMTYLERDEDVQRYQGQAFTWIGFDEVTQYSTPFAWNYLRSRLRSTDPELQKSLAIRGTTNPGGPGHGWVKQMFVDPAPPGTRFVAIDIETGQEQRYPEGHAKAGQPLFYRKFIPARLSDNPYLFNDGNYEANLLSMPEQQRKQLLDGDWNIADGAAFGEFRVRTHVCEPFEIPSNWRKFRSCDFGYSARSASAVHWYAIDPNNVLYVYRELYTSQKTAQDLSKLIKELERNDGTIDYGVLDSACWAMKGTTGPSVAEEMIQAGTRWRPADKGQGSRVSSKNRLHELLKVDPYSGVPGIIFFDTCRQIIADLQVIPVDPKGTDDIDDRYANDHAYDSIRYGIMTRPKTFSPFEMFGRNKTTQSYKPVDSTFGY